MRANSLGDSGFLTARSSAAGRGAEVCLIAGPVGLDIPVVADRVTNIYSTREILIEPYTSAHIPEPGVRNVLIATQNEYEKHLQVFGDSHPIDELIEGRVTHLGEMSSPDVRGLIWRTVNEVAATHGR